MRGKGGKAAVVALLCGLAAASCSHGRPAASSCGPAPGRAVSEPATLVAYRADPGGGFALTFKDSAGARFVASVPSARCDPGGEVRAAVTDSFRPAKRDQVAQVAATVTLARAPGGVRLVGLVFTDGGPTTFDAG